jgi:hypothetical protein
VAVPSFCAFSILNFGALKNRGDHWNQKDYAGDCIGIERYVPELDERESKHTEAVSGSFPLTLTGAKFRQYNGASFGSGQ